MPELAHRMSRQDAPSFRKNTYKDLQALEEMKLVIRDPIKLDRTVDFIYLSESGLEFSNEILNIPYAHIGTDWDNDYGDFAYELHRPPKVNSAMIHHHMMLTDVLLTFEKMKRERSDLNIDYRDNRYNSVEYELNGQLYRFKPDANFIFGKQGERYLMEVDRGTEYGKSFVPIVGTLDIYGLWGSRCRLELYL
jgi:DNA-binding MarR family transcriptional regulator